MLLTGEKKLASQIKFKYRFIDAVLSINYPDFDNFVGQMNQAECEIIKAKLRVISLFPTRIYSCQSRMGGDSQLRTSLYEKRDDFNFHITKFRFLGNVTISYPCQPMTFLSRSSYGMSWPAPLMNVLFRRWHDFHISLSCLDMSWNVLNSP